MFSTFEQKQKPNNQIPASRENTMKIEEEAPDLEAELDAFGLNY